MNKNLWSFYFLFSLFCFTNAYAQKEGNIWYFGEGAGIDFNNGTFVLTNGLTNTDEGSASISDEKGDLLFYSDGLSAFNRNHSVMPNGIGLLGHFSSTQSCLIVKKPCSLNIYYLFTSDAVGGSTSYSEVDMTLDFGKGDITSVKNVQILPDATEKLCAIKHENGIDVWVIAHKYNTNEFYAFLITSAGITKTVISPAGEILGPANHLCAGYMKSSPDGKTIANVVSNTTVDILEFNSLTGVINLKYTLPKSDPGMGIYSVEFSPDGTKLYIGDALSSGSSPGAIYQYDLSSGNPANILNSFTLIGTASAGVVVNTYVGSLKIGPDGKIYVARGFSGYLGVINNPDNLGIGCNYVDSAIYLEGKVSVFGLPNDLARGTANTEKECELELQMPNVFTPNNDNINDSFRPIKITGVSKGALKIFNRWGQKIFETYDLNIGWDGKFKQIDCSEGTYYWIVDFSNTKNIENHLTGLLTLLR